MIIILSVLFSASCGTDSKLTAKFSVKNTSVNGVKIGDPADESYEISGEGESKKRVKKDGGATFGALDGATEVQIISCEFGANPAPEVIINGKQITTVDEALDALGDPDRSGVNELDGGVKHRVLNYFNDGERMALTLSYYEYPDGSRELARLTLVGYPEGY